MLSWKISRTISAFSGTKTNERRSSDRFSHPGQAEIFFISCTPRYCPSRPDRQRAWFKGISESSYARCSLSVRNESSRRPLVTVSRNLQVLNGGRVSARSEHTPYSSWIHCSTPAYPENPRPWPLARIRKVFLRLSLVTCPVALYQATSEADKISFNQINKNTGHRIIAMRENVEGVELHLVIVLARIQRAEIADAVDAEHDRLAVDKELLVSVLQRGL